jgi:hypothetical protein
VGQGYPAQGATYAQQPSQPTGYPGGGYGGPQPPQYYGQQPQPKKPPWLAIGIGAGALVLVVVAAIIFIPMLTSGPTPTPTPTRVIPTDIPDPTIEPTDWLEIPVADVAAQLEKDLPLAGATVNCGTDTIDAMVGTQLYCYADYDNTYLDVDVTFTKVDPAAGTWEVDWTIPDYELPTSTAAPPPTSTPTVSTDSACAGDELCEKAAEQLISTYEIYADGELEYAAYMDGVNWVDSKVLGYSQSELQTELTKYLVDKYLDEDLDEMMVKIQSFSMGAACIWGQENAGGISGSIPAGTCERVGQLLQER